MACREHEAIPVKPMWIGWMMFEETRPKYIGHGCSAQRQAGMAAIGILYRIYR